MNLIKLGCVIALSVTTTAMAADIAPTVPTAPAAPAAEKPGAILQGRPDEHVINDEQLGPEFRSLAAGLAFRPPAGGKEIRRAVSGDEIVQYFYEKEKSQLKVSRLVFSKAAPLVTDREKDKDGIIRQGLLETMAQQLRTDTGGAEILRQDPINLASIPVGMIAARYSRGTETFLTQRALVQGDDAEVLYYILDFTTPAPRNVALDKSPETRKAVDLFSRVVESIQLLDQSRLVRDQTNRLFYTRALLVNLTEPKIRASLVPERWMRLIREGKDIGFSYVVEEAASGLPHKNEAPVPRAGNIVGVRVGIHSRTYPEAGVQVDAESWSWVAMDKKQEEWSSVLRIQNNNAKDEKLKKVHSAESGVATWRVKPVANAMMQAQNNRGIQMAEDWNLNVTINSSLTGLAEPVMRDLPVFYLPRTLDHLMPRLLPRGKDEADRPGQGSQGKGYMFASYVSDQKEVIKRYLDVGKEGEYILNGKPIHAVPIKDRIGLEGSATTHYISPEGEYLGSINLDSKVTILPSDYVTLEKMWKDAKLARPGDVDLLGAKP